MPPTPTSRTTSSQPVSRLVKGQPIPNTPEQSNPLANGKSRQDIEQDSEKTGSILSTENDAQKKGKQKSRWRRKPDKHSKKSLMRGFFDFLSNALISGIIIYALLVCPNNQQTPQQPICHSLSESRRLLLEPYVFPAVHQVLVHPSVAPYVEVAQPHVNRVLASAKPIGVRIQNEINARLVPQYNAYIAPQLHKVQNQLLPYWALADREYDRYVGPYVKLTIATLRQWQQRVQPYVILATSKTHNGYQAAKPYAKPAWRQIKTTVFRLIRLAGQYRRQFVDPHVAKMWMKIKELSSGKKSTLPTPIKVSSTASSPIQPEALETVAEIFIEEFTDTVSTFPVEPTDQPILTNFDDAAIETETTSAVIITPEVLSSAPGKEPDTIETVKELPDPAIPAETGTAASAVSETGASSSSSLRALSEEPTSEVFLSTSSSSDITGPSATPVSPDEVDLNAFYIELGLHETDAGKADKHESQVPFSAPPQESEEERVARLATQKEEVAKKRKEITERHSKWELELDELATEKKKLLKRSLLGLRKAAVVELKEHVDIRTAVERLVADAEKYLKGAEGYLKNLSKEDRKEEEKKALWVRVVDKVDEKFTGRLRETEVVVNEWYALVADAELAEVMKATAPVRDLSERAQADIGIDYAWLDDVTTRDWERYHDLMRRGENFKEEAMMIQNGTHTSPPINPIIPAIADLRSEVEDIVIGFETRLRRIKRNGDRVFGGLSMDNNEKREGDELGDEKPEVSILPINPDDELIDEVIPPVVIGKSQEQVLEALGNAGVETKSRSDPISPQEDVDEIVKEAEAESAATSSPHEEL